MQALLTRLGELTGVAVDVGSLEDQAEEYATRVEEGLAERPDVAELVSAIEEESGGEVSADDLADEIERFLRDQ
jgi:predicted ATP-grasp superfamily ATP-dependent carboligase